MSSTDKKTNQAILTTPKSNALSVASLPNITSSVLDDLVCTRRLTASALEKDDIPAALAFATASSKLVSIALKKGMKTNQLLTAAALDRIVKELVPILRSYAPDDETWATVADEIVPQIEVMQL